jgi:serine/threonine protein kinase
MGEVFLAHDRRLDTDVAIKRLTPQLASSGDLRVSLQREAQIMAKLSDASIVRLFDLAEFYGDFYLILEYVPGPTLRDMIRAGYRASPQELASAISDIAQGLTVAHNAGVIHRDLKPSNLLLALAGPEKDAYLAQRQLPHNLGHAKIKITDFGIAKAIADSHLTVTNAFSGTPGYMAPEQFRGELPSPQTDVYALGVITYELLTGQLPQQPIADVPSVHPAVTQVIRTALSPLREERFPSAAAYYQALYHAIEGKSPLTQAPVVAPARQQAWVVAVFSFLLVFAAIMGIATLGRRSSPPSPYVLHTPSKAPEIPKPPPIAWQPFPKVTELPAVVPEARGKITDPTGPTGPGQPKIEWQVALPDFYGTVAGIGKDGTVYLTGGNQICAVRNGKIVWAYSKPGLIATIQDFTMDADGRVWFKVFLMGDYEYYCLNRDGEGGRLPRSFASRFERPTDPYPFSCWKNKHTLSGPEGDMDLEDECKAVALGREGRIWVATDAPAILAVNQRQGKIEFTYKPSCEPAKLLPTLPNRLVFSCADGSLEQINGTTKTWTRPGEGAISDAKATTDGTVYFVDSANLRAIDTDGKLLWTIALPNQPAGAIAIGDHRLYLLQSNRDISTGKRLITVQ